MRYRSGLTLALIISCVLCMAALARATHSDKHQMSGTLTANDAPAEHGG